MSVTWDLESPGVRPVQQVVVRWMQENDHIQLPTPEDFPVNNTQIFDSPSQTFSCNFTGLSATQRYVVLIQGTNLVGTSKTFFVIETSKVLHRHLCMLSINFKSSSISRCDFYRPTMECYYSYYSFNWRSWFCRWVNVNTWVYFNYKNMTLCY